MKEQIKQRIALWKKIFAEGNSNFNEDSSWISILQGQNLDYDQTIQKVTKATMNYGGFTTAEKGSLEMRPYYKKAVHMLENISTIYGFWSISSPISENTYLRVRLCNVSAPGNIIPIYDAAIVTPEDTDLTDEFYFFVDGGNALRSKSIVLHYAKD